MAHKIVDLSRVVQRREYNKSDGNFSRLKIQTRVGHIVFTNLATKNRRAGYFNGRSKNYVCNSSRSKESTPRSRHNKLKRNCTCLLITCKLKVNGLNEIHKMNYRGNST